VNEKRFVHLHVHSAYSLLDGACRVNDLIEAAIAHDMPAIALTDHGVMYGVVDFYKAARDRGIKPIIGCETYITRGSRHDRKTDGQKRANHHLVLLAATDKGYRNLSRLISLSHLEGFYYKPRIDMEILNRYHEGLIGLSACLHGEVAAQLAEDDLPGAVRVAGEYGEVFGKDNFFIEVMDHGMPEQRRANRHMNELARQTGLPLVATNDVHYLKQEHAAAHEVMLCMQTGTVMSDPKRMRYSTDQFFLKTHAEMDRLFREFPGAVDRTLDIADRCNAEIEFGHLHFPTFDVPAGTTPRQYLIDLGCEGLQRLYHVADPHNPKDAREREIMERFRREIEVIETTGFVNYFLVVWDFIRYARERHIPVGPGRGSGGGSIVAYALGIISLDPLKYGLIFERFLNPERVSPPDFDIDFCQSRRGEVIDYVKNKYGADHVAQIITFGSLGAKTVVRDVGRVLEIPFNKCNELAKLIPDDLKMTLPKAVEDNPEFRHAAESDADLKRILEYGFVLEGLYRNPGTHAAGVVIGEKPLIEIVPLACDKEGQPVTQFAKEPVEEVGLLKMDFLGLKTLTVIQEAIDLIREIHGVTIDFETMPVDDPKTYALLSRADTVGVFQLESGGMRELIRNIGIDNIEDLIAVIALYRPGPMEMLPDYVERKTGRAAIKYDHPLLEPILKDTYGVMVYQEQVQKAANVLAGYSLGEADILRRAMGKKKADVMDAQRAKFVAGCKATNAINPRLAGSIFDNIAKFAGYGFNKAHSAGYAIVCYQTAYLKANYPAEFMAALISAEMGNFDKMPGFIREAQDMGLPVLPPDVNGAGVRFRPTPEGIRYGLAGIKGVGEGAARAIVTEREANGPFSGLVDFCARLDTQSVNKKAMESLARAGGLDSLGTHRACLFNGIEFAMARAASKLRDRKSGQGSLFDLMGDDPAQGNITDDELPECAPWHETEQLAGERELLGIYMTGHPLTRYADTLKLYRLHAIDELGALEHHTRTRIGGIASSIVRKITKKKENMAVVTLEDLEGAIEVVVFPDTYSRCGDKLTQDAALLVGGEINCREKQVSLQAIEIFSLDEAPLHFAQHVSIHITQAQLARHLEALREILRLHPGTVRPYLCLLLPGGEKIYCDTDPTFRVNPNRAFVSAVEQELGEHTVYVKVSPEPLKHPPKPRRG